MGNIGTKSGQCILVISQEPAGQFRWSTSKPIEAAFDGDDNMQIHKSGVIEICHKQSMQENMTNIADLLKEVCPSEAGDYSCPKVLKIQEPIDHNNRMNLALLCGLIATYGFIQHDGALASHCEFNSFSYRLIHKIQDDTANQWSAPGLQLVNKISSMQEVVQLA